MLKKTIAEFFSHIWLLWDWVGISITDSYCSIIDQGEKIMRDIIVNIVFIIAALMAAAFCSMALDGRFEQKWNCVDTSSTKTGFQFQPGLYFTCTKV